METLGGGGGGGRGPAAPGQGQLGGGPRKEAQTPLLLLSACWAPIASGPGPLARELPGRQTSLWLEQDGESRQHPWKDRDHQATSRQQSDQPALGPSAELCFLHKNLNIGLRYPHTNSFACQHAQLKSLFSSLMDDGLFFISVSECSLPCYIS